MSLKKVTVLGRGSFGEVYKVVDSQTGTHAAAAKVLNWNIITYPMVPGMTHPVQRFNQEIQILSSLQHPNIVRYYGTTPDPQVQQCIMLMMELMECSLTSFLNNVTHIPFHVEVNICHDISNALSYLHSQQIIHRDLSSNNVLLNTGNLIIAKVSDFGMAKIIDLMRTQSLTANPGTEVYMPPQVRTNPPQYTYKLDCFSLGVNILQILTKQQPNPSSHMVPHPTVPGAFIPVQEIDRRQNHLRLVCQSNPLLPILKKCLQENEINRPSAQQLWTEIQQLKSEHAYAVSQQNPLVMKKNQAGLH